MIDKEYYESKYFRSYTDLSKYKDKEWSAEIMMALHDKDGGVQGEFAMRWEILGGKLTPQIQAYSDSWIVLHCMSDLIEVLAEHDDEDISPNQLIEILESLDFIDTDSYGVTAYQKKDFRLINLKEIGIKN